MDVLRVTVVEVSDGVEGETRTADIVKGDYLLITHLPCRLDGIQSYPAKGTVVLTVKDHRPEAKA